jgi:hypothetical protein
MISLSKGSRQPSREAWTLDRLIHERSIALGSALDKSTYSNYTSALNSYIAFCKLHNCPIYPTEDTLSFYVVYMSHHIKPDSVDTYLSGICNQLEVHFPHVRTVRSSLLVSRTLKGCRRLHGSTVNRKHPLTITDLQHVLHLLPISPSHDDLLFKAMLLTGFHALLRCGELSIPDSIAKRNSRKITRRYTVCWPTPTSYGFILPATKTDPFFQGNHLVIQPFTPHVDPRIHFLTYLASRDSTFPLHPELWLTSRGLSPTRSWFINRLRSYFPDPNIAGQSMRAGGATCLASTGASPAIIQAAGRWASKTFQIYIRKNPILLNAMLHSDSQ